VSDPHREPPFALGETSQPHPAQPVDHDSPTMMAVEPSAGSSAAVETVIKSSGVLAGERPRLAGRYEILALVGAGGMGTVYRARDLELDETVALKVMRLELLSTPGILDRFRREAKLARRVTHKNVARVFDIGEHDGEKFLTMEFVEGEPLSAALARDGAFSLSRANTIASAVAEGLGSAHAAGVVHRDLKPDNVLLSPEGRVVITDFGIARALASAQRDDRDGGPANTMGVFVGTPAYMAPEQVEGRADVDARADVYAFGALLYELYTGHRAWPGDAPLAVATARLIHPPPDPRVRRPDLPAPLAELVLRCLARAPDQRPANMGEVLAALAPSGARGTNAGMPGAPTPPLLRAPAAPTMSSSQPTPPPVHAEKTVAVLPFRNAGDPADDYLAEELTDDLLDALSMTRGLKVRARGAVLRFRGVETDPREIGRELGVQVVVEGSVRKARGHVRISARLVSVADGFQIWAKRFDRPEQDVLSINDEAASAIAEALTLDGRRADARAREAPSDPLAIDLYLRARHEYRQFWPQHQGRAIELFDQALAIAPDDPLLLSGMALALARLSFFHGDSGSARARAVAERAVAAAPHLGEAHLALGSVLFQLGEAPSAVRSLRAAVSRSPGLAEAHGALGRLLCEAGAVDEGVRRLETSLSLDPDAPLVIPELTRAYALLGQWDRADATLSTLAHDGGQLSYWTLRARIALWRREPALVERYLADLPDSDPSLLLPRLLLEVVRTGKVPTELSDIEKTERAGGVRRQVFALQMRAEVLAFLGQDDPSLDALQRAAERGLLDRFWLDRCPLLDSVRRSPRFAGIYAEVRRRTDAVLEAYRAP
jgi:serine/threonine protein kinase/tetratricopeptide (TPR) repeat protein